MTSVYTKQLWGGQGSLQDEPKLKAPIWPHTGRKGLQPTAQPWPPLTPWLCSCPLPCLFIPPSPESWTPHICLKKEPKKKIAQVRGQSQGKGHGSPSDTVCQAKLETPSSCAVDHHGQHRTFPGLHASRKPKPRVATPAGTVGCQDSDGRKDQKQSQPPNRRVTYLAGNKGQCKLLRSLGHGWN